MVSKHTAAVAYIRELCSLGLTGELLIPALLEALHRVIPSARNLFDWVSAEGRIQRYYFEGSIDHDVARLYFDEFHNRREAEAMPRYADVILGEATIHSAEELNHRQFFDSALYHEIWRPQRLHYRLEAIVRKSDGKPLGSLVLYRERGDRVFGRDDEQVLKTLVPYIAHGLQHGREQQIEFDKDQRRAVLVNLDAAGRIVHLSRDAHKVLLLAHSEISPTSAAQPPVSEDFPSLLLLHRQLSRAADRPDANCALTLTNAWGRFDFRAEHMQCVGEASGPLIGVTIQHHRPREVRDLGTMQAQHLSVAQRKVCAGLLRNQTHAQIAALLGLSANTVADHVRKIYTKFDVHSVEQLRAHLEATGD